MWIKGFGKKMAWISGYMYPLSHPLPLVNKGEDISMTQITKHLISMTQISNLRPEFKVSHNYFDELLGLNF